MTSGLFGAPSVHVVHKKGLNLLTDPGLFAPVNKIHACKRCQKLVQYLYYKDEYDKAKKNGYSKSCNTFVKEMG